MTRTNLLILILSLFAVGCADEPPVEPTESGNMPVVFTDADRDGTDMTDNEFWQSLCKSYPRVPKEWGYSEGDDTEGPYRHGTSILGLSFSPDDRILSLAGGGMLPGADDTIRLIDTSTLKNIKTLHGHVHGIHDVSFDRETGLLASASFDYSVFLWNLAEEDVIYLRGLDEKTKGYSQFSREGSLLAIGEYEHYAGPHSFYIYDLNAATILFEMSLPNDLGVSSLAFSPDSTYLAVASGNVHGDSPTIVYLINLETKEIEDQHQFSETTFFDLEFVDGHKRILAGIYRDKTGEFESGLMEIDAKSGDIVWEEILGGIGVVIASHPDKPIVAVGHEGSAIHFYSTSNWELLHKTPYKAQDKSSSISSLAWSHKGDRLAYGLSNGVFNIIRPPFP